MSMKIVELINKYQTDGDSYEFLDNTGRIIRCKDCDHCLDYGDCLVCNIAQIVLNVEPDDFCSKAELKRIHTCDTCRYEDTYCVCDAGDAWTPKRGRNTSNDKRRNH